MLNYIAAIIFATFVIALVVALINLYFGAKHGGLAAHAERIALSPFDWKTAIVTMVVLYVFLIAVCALIYTTGFGGVLLYFTALPINMNMGGIFHRAICVLIHKANGAPVPMPA
ncbi:hypothetical protein [Burkholderia phage FLC9]|nr:hypothetical protein [Burkholderia phage FLC9]